MHKKKLEYITKKVKTHVNSTPKDLSIVSKRFGVPQLSSTQINLLRVVTNTKNLSGEHAIACAGHLGYDRGCFISGISAKAYITKLQNAYLN